MPGCLLLHLLTQIQCRKIPPQRLPLQNKKQIWRIAASGSPLLPIPGFSSQFSLQLKAFPKVGLLRHKPGSQVQAELLPCLKSDRLSTAFQLLSLPRHISADAACLQIQESAQAEVPAIPV